MNILAMTGTVVGTLVFACLFDHVFEKIIGNKPPEGSIEHFREIIDSLEPKEFKRRRMKKKIKSAINNLMIWKQAKN